MWRRRPAAKGTGETRPEDEAAREAATDRLRSDPRDLGALVILAASLLSRGHAEEALECLHRVTRTAPAYPGIWWVKAKAFEALGDGRNAEACRARAAALSRRGEG